MTEYATVTVTDGAVRGRKVTTKSGSVIYSFKGIPYAKPPIGPLRFKICEPPEPWSGVRDTFKEGDSCTQFRLDTRCYEGTEDCLYINVYTPQLPETRSSPLPVMVWIHGGGYVMGAGDEVLYGPEFLLNEQVIFVSFNYRLGVLGFLCLNHPVAPGNVGLKDQVAALRWVQKNIAQFGGDPNNVTIFGESAGGASVNCHMLSPLSKGLFHKAIPQSGASFSPWGWENNPQEMAFRLGAELGCNTTDPEKLVEFLRTLDHMKLVSTAGYQRDKQRLMAFAFVPVAEIEVPGIERFFAEHPLTVLQQGIIHDVPYMTGVTSHEGILVLRWVDFNDPKTTERLDKNFDDMVFPDLRFPQDHPKKAEICAKIKKFYFGDKPICKETLPQYIDLYSDLWFCEGIHVTLKNLLKHSKSPLYYYCFTLEGRLSSFKIEMKLDFPGACHGDEIGHMYRVAILDPELEPLSPEAITRKRMAKMWTNFAKFGNPTPEVNDLIPVKWEQHTANNPCYIDIGKELQLKKDLFKARMAFWEELYRTS